MESMFIFWIIFAGILFLLLVILIGLSFCINDSLSKRENYVNDFNDFNKLGDYLEFIRYKENNKK